MDHCILLGRGEGFDNYRKSGGKNVHNEPNIEHQEWKKLLQRVRGKEKYVAKPLPKVKWSLKWSE